MSHQPSDRDDIALMDCIDSRDEDCLQQLHQRYHALLLNMAMYILKDRGAAEEVVQDIFLAVWQRPERWDPDKGKLTSWLLSITRYTAIDRLRSEQRRAPVLQTPLDHVAHLLQRPGIRHDKGRDNADLLKKLVRNLPKNQQQVIFLAYFRGMTHTEIAETLKIPVGTVKSRIRLGLQKLKTQWQLATADPNEVEYSDEL